MKRRNFLMLGSVTAIAPLGAMFPPLKEEDLPLTPARIEKLGDEMLPVANKGLPQHETYAVLCEELKKKVHCVGDLRKIISKNLAATFKNEHRIIKSQERSIESRVFHGTCEQKKRAKKKVFFLHVGLIRICLEVENGG